MFILLLILSYLQLILAFTIEQGCLDPGFLGLGSNIPAAVAEALSMAEYGQWRLQTNQPAVGAVLQQLLGNDGHARQSFIDRMGAVPAAFGPYRGIFDPTTMHDPTVVIRCKETVLMQDTDPNDHTNILGWWDLDFPGMPGLVGAAHPCNPQVAALTYVTGLSRTQNVFGTATVGPSHVIMLCSLYPGQAMYRRNTIGMDWSQRRWDGLSFDLIAQYLTPTLLHEAMHVTGLPGILPSGRREMYEWSGIESSTRSDDKQANADSYSILASVLWMKRNTIGSQGLWGRRHRVNNRPGNSPHDGHP